MRSRITRSLFFMGSILLFACGAEEPEPKPAVISNEQRRTLLELFAMPAKIVGDSAGGMGASAPAYRASSTVNCTPQQLMPPRDCPAGGNIYFTINLGCTGPSLCCGNEPPCQEDNVSISGLGTATYNNCAAVSEAGDRIVVNGSLHIGVDSDTTLTCQGVYDSEAMVRVNGIPSVRVNGREACPGTVNIEARAKYEYEAVTTVQGSACGVTINEIYAEGCIVACDSGSCCPGGSLCSSTGSGCVPNGYVDCGNGKHCPPGSQCTADGQNCQY